MFVSAQKRIHCDAYWIRLTAYKRG